MGREKAKEKLGGQTMLGKIKTIARGSGLEVRVIRRDCVPRCGPLGGILTGLKSSGDDAVLFLACDMPFITVELLKRLLRAFDHREALFVRSKAGIGFPIILRREVWPKVARQIERRELSLHRLAAILETKLVRLPKTFTEQLRNLNTPAELEEARRRRGKSKGCIL